MSIELKTTSKSYFFTQFVGPKREDGGDSRKLQVTGSSSPYAPYFTITKDEVIEFVNNLVDDINKITDPEDTIIVGGISMSPSAAVRLGWDMVSWFEDKLVEHYY